MIGKKSLNSKSFIRQTICRYQVMNCSAEGNFLWFKAVEFQRGSYKWFYI